MPTPVQGRRRPAPGGQCVPHDVTQVAFWPAPGAIYMVVNTRDDNGAPSDIVVGEFTPEESLEMLGKFAEATRWAMEATDRMPSDAVRTPNE